jgi:hypothetical protein
MPCFAHFLAVDRPALRRLPAERFALFEVGTRSVHPDDHIEVGAAFYSVPHQCTRGCSGDLLPTHHVFGSSTPMAS